MFILKSIKPRKENVVVIYERDDAEKLVVKQFDYDAEIPTTFPF